MRFSSKYDTKELKTHYAVKRRRDLYITKNDSQRMEVKCVEGCPFRVWSS